MNTSLTMYAIGTIHTPHTEKNNTPVQPKFARGIEGRVVVNEDLEPALDDLEGFSHICLIFHLHKSPKTVNLKVTPFLDTRKRGLFSTRSPSRPNPIGLSVVRLISRHKNILKIEDVDMLDGTPLLDIKPYIPLLEADKATHGWTDSLRDHTRDEIYKMGNRSRREDTPDTT